MKFSERGRRRRLYSSAEFEEMLQRLASAFEQSGALCAYLFGSYAREGARHTSDIDLAVWIEPVTAERYRRLWRAVYEALGTERFDLVLLNQASPAFAFNIISEGQLIFVRHAESLNQIEHRLLRNYRDTHYLRRRRNLLLKEKIAGRQNP